MNAKLQTVAAVLPLLLFASGVRAEAPVGGSNLDLAGLPSASPGEEAGRDLFRTGDELDENIVTERGLVDDESSLLEAEGARFPGPWELVKRSPQYRGLAARYRIVGIAEGDLDGDGLREYVVGFRQDRGTSGGFAVIGFRSGKFQLLWAGVYEHSRPEELTVERGFIRARATTARGTALIALEHGKDFWFSFEKQGVLQGAKVTVSSAARGARAEEHAAAHLIDGDHDTVWCTATVGTGVGEWAQVELARPVDVGLVVLVGGDFRSKAQWQASNRIFRFDLIAETTGDRTTIVEQMDLTEMLKLPTMGKRVSASLPDAMRSKWAEVRYKGVVGLKFEVASVYLGETNDELCAAEIELGVILPDPEPRSAAPVVATPASLVPAPAPKAP